MRRGYVLLGAVAFLVGALTPLTVSAEEYDELGTLAEGVFVVESSEERFRITAEEPAGVAVYEPSGDLVVAQQLDAGDEHAFVLDDGRAIVALFGGQAAIEATGDGDVREIETTSERIELVSADGEAVDETVTIELPAALVGLTGEVDGTAEDLLVEGRTDEGVLFRADQDEITNVNREIAPDALDARTLEVAVDATSLDGTISLELVTPVLPTGSSESEANHRTVDEAQAQSEADPEPPIGKYAHTPVRFEVTDQATLTFDIAGGYLFDASVYAEDGSQVFHAHEGPDLAQARSDCRDVLDCPLGYDRYRADLAPTEIEHTLDAGTYMLYVREGAVDGNLTLTGADGQTLLDDKEVLRPTVIEVYEDREIELSTPLLDVLANTWSHGVDQYLRVSVDDADAYTYRATASGGPQSVDEERSMAPEALGAGNVTVEMGGISGPHDGLGVQLVTAAG